MKDEVNEGRIAVTSGMTGEGDGRLTGVSLNNGSAIGDNAGFVNYTVDLFQELAKPEDLAKLMPKPMLKGIQVLEQI